MAVELSTEERSIYPIAIWSLVWPVLYPVAARMTSPAVGAAFATFVLLLGVRFVAPRARRGPLLSWVALSVALAAVSFLLRLGIDRLFAV